MNKTIKNIMLVLTALGVFSTLQPQYTWAREPNIKFTDKEDQEDILLETESLDMEMRGGQDNFVEGDDLFIGDTTARDVYIKNTGTTDFKYKSFIKVGDETDENLCENLELKVWYNRFDESGNKHAELKYTGSLMDFEMNFEGEDEELQIPNGYSYEENPMYAEKEHWLYYRIQVPEEAPYEVSQKACDFEIVTIAWQQELIDENQGFWDIESLQSSITTGDWTPSAPTGLKILNHKEEELDCSDPENPAITNNRNITIDWTDNPEFDLEHYDLGIKDKLVHDDFIEESLRPATVRDEDGDYKYRVRAVDEGGNISEWSDWCYLILDRTIDDAEEGEVLINEVMWSGSSENTSDEWIELYNESDREIKLKNWTLSIGDETEITLPEDEVIEAHSYFLISKYDEEDGNSALNVTPDLVAEELNLEDAGSRLTLKDAFNNEIDSIDASSEWPAGEVKEDPEIPTTYHSMERSDDPSNWHTCKDSSCNDAIYWDVTTSEGEDPNEVGTNYGTPGSENSPEGSN
ncbi:hypothetical protein GF360_03600 [candidate division WWE3 bacterium]|nr:hypothetical protein [candidate division WWE3 bacterium]